jgi:ribonuclease H / adenosylcobalamin/alpha-ribazole phosphatase
VTSGRKASGRGPSGRGASGSVASGSVASGSAASGRQPTPTKALPHRPSGAIVRFDDEPALTVVLVRHGETPMTVSRAYSGSSVPGPSLSAAGRVQAARAADLVARIGRTVWTDLPHPEAVVASPMVRTRETAMSVGRRLGRPVTVDPAFAEAHFGEWEGRTATQIEERWPGALRRWHWEGARAPGGESVGEVGDRVRAGLEGLLTARADRAVVVVSHAIAVRAAVGVTLGTPPTTWGSVRVLAASVTVLRWWADGGREAVVVGMPTDTGR